MPTTAPSMTSPTATTPVTLLTGASGGIVGALAVILARAGHRLVLSGLDEPGLTTVAADVAAAGGQAVTLAGDLRERDLPGALVDLAVSSFGRLDHLVTGAGASRPVSATSARQLRYSSRVIQSRQPKRRVSQPAMPT